LACPLWRELRSETITGVSLVPTSIAQYVSKYTEFLNKLLSAGPDISEDLADLQTVRDCILRIVTRSSKRFGYSAERVDVLDETQWQQIRSDSTVKSLEQQVGQEFASRPLMGAAGGNEALGGPFTDVLSQLFTFLMQHPELLNLILTLFKKPA
jgi:hypothetical protein